MIITGKIIHEDNERIIELFNYKDQVKTYKIYQMQKHCFCCKKKVHRDAGKYLMNDKIKRLNLMEKIVMEKIVMILIQITSCKLFIIYKNN